MKKILAIALTALMLCALSVGVCAAETNYVFHDVNGGNDANDGLTLSTPKKTWGAADGNGTIAQLLGYGDKDVTLVISGKVRPGADVSIPTLGGHLTITALYGSVDFKNPMPTENPAGGVWKQAGGTTFTFNSDVTFDNIIIFQENTVQEALRISGGATITITDTVMIMQKPGNENAWKLIIDEGCTAKLSADALSLLDIENHGTVLDLEGKPATIPAAEGGAFTATMMLGKAKYVKNGKTFAMDVAPFANKDGRTMVPVRYVGDIFGVAPHWDGATGTATFVVDGKVLKFVQGSKTGTLDGVAFEMDTAVENINGRLCVPIRFAVEQLGGKVTWDDATKTATITSATSNTQSLCTHFETEGAHYCIWDGAEAGVWQILEYESQQGAYKGTKLKCKIFLPENYDNTKQYPFFMYLHGAGGADVPISTFNIHTSLANTVYLENKEAIVLFPQCLPDNDWPFSEQARAVLMELIEHLCEHASADRSRLYISGHSYGSIGTLKFLDEYPGYFAAAYVTSGALSDYSREELQNIAKTPIRMFCGAKDEYADFPIYMQSLYNRLKNEFDADVEYTVYPDLGHSGVYTRAGNDLTLMQWILDQKLDEN